MQPMMQHQKIEKYIIDLYSYLATLNHFFGQKMTFFKNKWLNFDLFFWCKHGGGGVWAVGGSVLPQISM
jgi:hypothetical protein